MAKTLKEAASEEHQRLVKVLIAQLLKDGLNILQASYEGYDEPEKEGRHEPDIRAWDANEELIIIGEAKTCDDLGSETTKEQFQDFSSRQMAKGKSKGKALPFHVIVPKACKDELASVLTGLDILGKPNIRRWSL